ncbi:MAG: hypothetical protein R2939_11955 [Kofleriaceae bacterium]
MAQRRCGDLEPRRRRQLACAQALLGEAELLERSGRLAEAADAYAAIPARVDDDPATAAIATYRVAGLALQADDVTGAWAAYWQVVTAYPDEPVAADAVTELVRDGRGRDARALSAELFELLTPLAGTAVADNLLWALGDLAAHELDDAALARGYYDRIPVDMPTSGLRDDARWRAAQLSLALGDARGAEQRLLALLATREVAFGTGSYFSIWLDDAQLAVGRIRRDRLADLDGAVRAFAALPELYPASILRDDALWELSLTHVARGDLAAACAARARLAQAFPESRWVGVDARAPLACPEAR